MNAVQSLIASPALPIAGGLLAPVVAAGVVYVLASKVTRTVLDEAFPHLKKYADLIAFAPTILTLGPLLDKCLPLFFVGANPAFMAAAVVITGVAMSVLAIYQIKKLDDPGSIPPPQPKSLSSPILESASSKINLIMPTFGYDRPITEIGRIVNRPLEQKHVVLIGKPGAKPRSIVNECIRLSTIDSTSPFYNKKVFFLCYAILFSSTFDVVTSMLQSISECTEETVVVVDEIHNLDDSHWQTKRFLSCIKENKNISLIGITTEDKLGKLPNPDIFTHVQVEKLEAKFLYENLKGWMQHASFQKKYSNIEIDEGALALSILLSFEDSQATFRFEIAQGFLIDALERLKGDSNLITKELFMEQWSEIYSKQTDQILLHLVPQSAKDFFQKKGVSYKDVFSLLTQLDRQKPKDLLVLSSPILEDASSKTNLLTPVFGYDLLITQVGEILDRPLEKKHIALFGKPGANPRSVINECIRLSTIDSTSPFHNKKVFFLSYAILIGTGGSDVTEMLKSLSQLAKKTKTIVIVDEVHKFSSDVYWQTERFLSCVKENEDISLIGITTKDGLGKLPAPDLFTPVQVDPLEVQFVFENLKKWAQNASFQKKYSNIEIDEGALALSILLSFEDSHATFRFEVARGLLLDVLERLKGSSNLVAKELFMEQWSNIYSKQTDQISLNFVPQSAKDFFQKKGVSYKDVFSRLIQINRQKAKDPKKEPSFANDMMLEKEPSFANDMMLEIDEQLPVFGRDSIINEIETILRRPLSDTRNIVLLGDPICQPELVAYECAKRSYACTEPTSPFFNKVFYRLNVSQIITTHRGPLREKLRELSKSSKKIILVVDQMDLLSKSDWHADALRQDLKNHLFSIIGITSPSKFATLGDWAFAQNLQKLPVGPLEAEHSFQTLTAKIEQGELAKAYPNITITPDALALATLLSYHYVPKYYSVTDAIILISDLFSKRSSSQEKMTLDQHSLLEYWQKFYAQKSVRISLTDINSNAQAFFKTQGIDTEQIKTLVLEINKKKKNSSNQSDIPPFLIDMNEAALEGRYSPCIGREEEIRMVIQKLRQPKNKSLVLVGHPGIGKTAIFEEVARRIVKKDPLISKIEDKIFYWVDTPSLVGHDGYTGVFEKKINSLLTFARSRAGNAVFIIDELHQLRGAGLHKGSNTDALEMMKNPLGRDEIIVLGTSNDDIWDPLVEQDKAIGRRIKSIGINPPTPETCFNILKETNQTGYYTQSYDPCLVELTDAAILAAVRLTTLFQKNLYLPDKAIELISQTVSYYQDREERALSASSSKKQITPSEIAYCLYPSIENHPEVKKLVGGSENPRGTFVLKMNSQGS